MTDEGGWRPNAPEGPRGQRPDHPLAFPEPAGDEPASQATPVRPLTDSPPPPPAFDALGMQSVLTRARDQSRFEAPPVEEQRAGRRFPLRGLLYGLIGVLVIGVVAGFVYVNFFRETEDGPGVLLQPTESASQLVVARTPQDVVTEYFSALAEGDVDRALALGERGSGGLGTLLTAEAYARTRELAPIGDVEILTDDPTATEVRVRYTMGGTPVESSVRLTRQGSEGYSLASTTVARQFQFVGGENVPVFVNGVRVDPVQPLELLPGRYELTTGLPFITYPAENGFTIDSLAQRDLPQPVTPELTDEGRAEFMREARASLDRCLASTEISPTGCPFSMTADSPVVPGSPNWSLLNDPWEGVTPTLNADDQSQAIMTVNLATRLTLDYTDGSTGGNNDQNWTVQATANMLAEEPDEVHVTWQG